MRMRLAIVAAVLLVGLLLAYVWLRASGWMRPLEEWISWSDEGFEVEVADYRQAAPKPEDELVDDPLGEKNPPFIAGLIDRRPEGGWQLNASAAVLRLAVPMLKPDADADLLELRPSYADAMAKAPGSLTVLPSINMIDGKAKQFDDGLFAAIELAYYNGNPRLASPVSVIERLKERVAPDSAASAYLAAGLEIARAPAKPAQANLVSSWLSRFESDAMASKPFSFYAWNPELSQAFRFMRFFQQPLPSGQPDLLSELSRAVRSDPKLVEDYKRLTSFSARLTNPPDDFTLADMLEHARQNGRGQAVAVFPSARSKETALFRRMFPRGLPASADLMRELLKAIRHGKVDLAPGPDSGWYEYQVYALETLLVPEKGTEHSKLLLTKEYKKRMLEAVAAVMTKRRETHARTLADVKSAAPMLPPVRVKPRLRVEPCPSYYLRTARAYGFLLNFLLAALGEEELASLHGLKEGGQRSKNLLDELRWMREFFYGLHLLSAEDIGMSPELHPDEPVDRAVCEAKAGDWLASYHNDVDLKVDARVSVPIYFDIPSRKTRLWATLGVRLARLDVSYAKPPRIKPAAGPGDWLEVKPEELDPAVYCIAVDEFAEAEISGLQPLTRQEFRDVCNAHKSRPEILRALRQGVP
jgi:hypothetical protein